MSDIEDQPRAGAPTRLVNVAPHEVALIPIAAAATGMSEKAIRRKIEDEVWKEGEQYFKAPDGHIWIYMPGITRWVRGDAAAA